MHLLSQIRHQNLVSLEGFCHESKQQILIYEYLPGGSLADHLYGILHKQIFYFLISITEFDHFPFSRLGTNSKKVSLSWVRRLKIAVDAAKGIYMLYPYLHFYASKRSTFQY